MATEVRQLDFEDFLRSQTSGNFVKNLPDKSTPEKQLFKEARKELPNLKVAPGGLRMLGEDDYPADVYIPDSFAIVKLKIKNNKVCYYPFRTTFVESVRSHKVLRITRRKRVYPINKPEDIIPEDADKILSEFFKKQDILRKGFYSREFLSA